ncbi:MAG: purple acid phosphatase family protein [Acidimicrobiales bacterium]
MNLRRRPPVAGAPAPEQLHLQFGADAARQMVASWATPVPVAHPRLRLGTPGGGLGTTVDAVERTYTEALTGQAVWSYHAMVEQLQPDTEHIYEVVHDGSPPETGRFRTAPSGRAPFRFTSFGDLSLPQAVGAGLGPASPNAGFTVAAVEAAEPLFHLINGDLSYANASEAPVETWRAFFANTSRSARHRPWMPCAGNHENEVGNGPQGYLGYQTRFFVPDNGAQPDFIGNWYAFTVAGVRVVSLNADDVCLQDGGFSGHRCEHLPAARRSDTYIRGYSGGAQRAWLEATLADARRRDDIDWVVVCMHQVAMSSAAFNGADLGIRQELLPLFDRYEVDLVVSGHEHHYERTHPVRGVVSGSSVLTPAVTGTGADGSVDTTTGTVHVTIGVGGNPVPAGAAAPDTPRGLVICEVGAAGNGQRPARKVSETAEWLAARADDHPYGFTAFDVDPGSPGGWTRIEAVHYGARAGSVRYRPVDRFTLTRPRRDAVDPGAPAAEPSSLPAATC